MVRIEAIARILMILLCLVPFTSARQVSGVIAPCAPLAPLAPVNEAPAPVSEEDDERESAKIKERIALHARQRPPAWQHNRLPPLAHARHHCSAHPFLTSHFDADPFRNGLGTPYRC